MHLESLSSERLRAQQLEIANRELSSFPRAVLCGDFK